MLGAKGRGEVKKKEVEGSRGRGGGGEWKGGKG